MTFEDFVFLYGKLDSENEWVRLAGLVPWDTVKKEYAKQFVDNGHPAHTARIALGALIIKQRLKCSDARIERLSFDAFNEASDFFRAVESYRKRNGFIRKGCWQTRYTGIGKPLHGARNVTFSSQALP